jgi:hypothetical protein
MAVVLHPKSDPKAAAIREQVVRDLDRGELVRLLAAVDAGRLDRQEFEKALEQYANKRWFWHVLSVLFDR